MDNDIIYHLENSEQFWAELDEILAQGENNLNSALSSTGAYIKFVSNFQDEYLESETEVMHCFYKLFVSPVYQNFSDKVADHIIQLAAEKKDVKELWVLYNILFLAGNENKEIFKRMINAQGQIFISKLKNHIRESKDVDKLQQISVNLLFEISHIQHLSDNELDLIDESFLNHLLDLVEKTRNDVHETFNYSVIRLILSFHEQFTMNIMPNEATECNEDLNPNTVIQVLGERIGNSKTFGENVIFMFNRAADDHIQMLILKLLYVIFTTPKTLEYFYTNDLRVIMDVFIRELYDLPEESEPLRNAYLRVLLPLLKNNQLCQRPYKQHQIHSLLSDLVSSSIKPISPTTRRLAERCLMTEYLEDIISSRNGIKRVPTPNALVMVDTVGNKNSSNGSGFAVEVVLESM